MASSPSLSSSTTAAFHLCLLLPLFLFLSISGSAESATTARIQRGSLSPSRKILGSSTDEEVHPTLLQSTPKKNRTTETKKKTNGTPVEPKKTDSTARAGDASGMLGSDGTSISTSKSLEPSSNSTKLLKPIIKLNSTSKSLNPSSNSTKLVKPSIKLNSTSTTVAPKTTKKNTTSTTKTKNNLKPLTATTTTAKIEQSTTKPKQEQGGQQKALPKPVKIMPWLDETDVEEESDLVSEFRDLPSKFHDTFLPDLEHLSTKSKAYLTLANKEFTNTFKPIVGQRYASTLASLVFAAFLLLPLALVALLFHHLRHLLSLQKILLAVQIYLATYFSLLCLAALLTGLEPLRFFHATSPDSYVYTQVLQTMGYVLYLLLQLMNLMVLFSGDGGPRPRALALVQLIVGLAVGLHYYAAVFHRAVLGQAPKTNWKIHAVYATCFIVICTLARAERRKKAYGGGDDCKKS